MIYALSTKTMLSPIQVMQPYLEFGFQVDFRALFCERLGWWRRRLRKGLLPPAADQPDDDAKNEERGDSPDRRQHSWVI